MPLLPQTNFKTIPELIISLVTKFKREVNKLQEQILTKNQLLEFKNFQTLHSHKTQNQIYLLTTQLPSNKNHLQISQTVNLILRHHQAQSLINL